MKKLVNATKTLKPTYNKAYNMIGKDVQNFFILKCNVNILLAFINDIS